ncbi:uncharacterized protein EI90DRAFT_3012766 [Cantharellus anzutake]|uniref:uncharacterized protein n=1 Tax=Cantharellus anzutake TaxID=1750568 RepID=UPI001903AF34|nr:uncharacterized protein EI90DRAFT_3012766 [Cantharellus anzutake]KAF8339837.1 hypothetical protein EI90DRAFT_3012766 [Cantharellus anzutake]
MKLAFLFSARLRSPVSTRPTLQKSRTKSSSNGDDSHPGGLWGKASVHLHSRRLSGARFRGRGVLSDDAKYRGLEVQSNILQAFNYDFRLGESGEAKRIFRTLVHQVILGMHDPNWLRLVKKRIAELGDSTADNVLSDSIECYNRNGQASIDEVLDHVHPDAYDLGHNPHLCRTGNDGYNTELHDTRSSAAPSVQDELWAEFEVFELTKKSTRLFPPRPSGDQIAVEADVIPLGQPIHTKDGTQIHSIRIHKGQGPDGTEFIPARWLKTAIRTTHPEATVSGWNNLSTFGEGRHVSLVDRRVGYLYWMQPNQTSNGIPGDKLASYFTLLRVLRQCLELPGKS